MFFIVPTSILRSTSVVIISDITKYIKAEITNYLKLNVRFVIEQFPLSRTKNYFPCSTKKLFLANTKQNNNIQNTNKYVNNKK